MRLFDPRLAEDLQRYPRRSWWREQSLWAIAVYRFGQQNDKRPEGFIRWLFDRIYWVLFRVVETLAGVSIPKSAQIGGGLRIHHFGCVFIHADVHIGAQCTLRQGVTIGNRTGDKGVPVIGDDVEIGAFAQLLGRIRVGDGCRIGAMAVVIRNVPDGATAVGNPARLLAPGSARNEETRSGANTLSYAASL